MWRNSPIDCYNPQDIERHCTRLSRNTPPDQGSPTRIPLEHGPGATARGEVAKVGSKSHAEDQSQQGRFKRPSVEKWDMHVQQVLKLEMPKRERRENHD